MLQLGIWLMWLVLYHYYIEQICNLEKGYKKRVVVWGMTGGALLAVWAVTVAGQIFRGSAGGLFTEAGQDPAGAVGALSTVAVSETGEALPSMVGKERSGGNGVWSAEAGQENGVVAGVWSAEAEQEPGEVAGIWRVLAEKPGSFAPGWPALWGWLLTVLIFFLYVLFYDGEPFGQQWWKVLAPGLLLILCARFSGAVLPVLLNGAVMVFFLWMLAYAKGYFRIGSGFLNASVYGILCLYVWGNRGTADVRTLLGILCLELLLFLCLEGTLSSWNRGFQARTELFQRDILSHQYEEVKEIYLNMRGWRHDYHNHLQVMKAQIAAGQLEEMKDYLDDLEQNLDEVDTYVKSGNLMADAILNSKLSLAGQKGIRVNCKAILPETFAVEDVDLCVLLGNLLDNALEACEKIPAEQRFLRIYMVVNKSQLYISIQNSAREELDFNERNYISTKRGNHGLGMKRVKALADKYEGFLTLANEPGIFAAEVTLPL